MASMTKSKAKKDTAENASKSMDTENKTEDTMNPTVEDSPNPESTINAVAETVVPVEVEAIKTAAIEAVQVEEDDEVEDNDEDEDDEDDEDDEEVEDDDEDVAETSEVIEDGILRIPENEFAFLKEILKNPLGNNEFEISKEAPKAAFPGRKSTKTLAQTAKKSLIERKIIESVKAGGAQSRAIVRLLIDNVEMSNEGRGRKVNTPNTGTGRKPGRPKGSVSTTSPRTPQDGPAATETRQPGRPGRQSNLKHIFDELRGPHYEDPNEFEAELEKFQARFPTLFNKLIRVLRKQVTTAA